MKIGHVADILKTLGWELSRVDGDRVAEYGLPDRTVSIWYSLKHPPDEQLLILIPSVRESVFSRVCAEIGDRDAWIYPSVTTRCFPSITVPEILEQHVRQGSETVIAWAREQDLDEALREHAALPTNSRGTLPIKHFAALALTGDVDRLKSYQASLDAGDRLGFVPYITRDHIDRALQLAESLEK